ncbi:37389_t:CDS:2 [Gigaspora margarita]|uniref:37389_t:CDS:1 n=1 Tax=Gigaspora margarita TaxID=4874 RepID=A0ABN7UMN6_GIGMA|nr:37389_t:CDS:2 [Gigaspora margarita]
MSTTALMKASLDKIIGMQYLNFEFDEIINTADNFLTTQENVDNMIHINENNAVNDMVHINEIMQLMI